MKTLSESIREALDAISTAMIAPAEQVSEAPVKYDLTLKIDNPAEFVDDENVAWEDEIDVGVTYRLHGNYQAADMVDPASYPSVEDLKVFDLKTGQEITNQLPHDTISYIEDKIFDADEEERSEAGVRSRFGRIGR